MAEIFQVDSYEEMQNLSVKHGDITYVIGQGSFICQRKLIGLDDAGSMQVRGYSSYVNCTSSIKYKPTFPKQKGRGGKFKKY